MIEIVFGDSAAGSLRIAQSYGKGPYPGSAVGIILRKPDGTSPTRKEIKKARQQAEERERKAWEEAEPMGGNPQDIFSFELSLSIGDITENQPGPKRLRALEQLAGIYPDEKYGARQISDTFRRVKDDFEEISRRILSGEAAHIWYSSNPDELCGLIWLAAQLSPQRCGKEYTGSLYAVRLPQWSLDRHGTVFSKTCWGETLPEEWHRYLSLQEILPSGFCSDCLTLWQTLQNENAPLRTVLNGQPVSVPENFYDNFLLRELAAEEEIFHEARLIGKIMGKYRLGISDSFLSLRIEDMIRRGLLKVITQAEKGMPIYHRVLQKQR